MRGKTLTLTLAACAGGALCAAYGPVAAPTNLQPAGALPAASAADDITVPDWERQYDKALDFAVDELAKLSKWCVKEQLEWTSNYVRRRSFRYRPDHPELRAEFGYERDPAGRWVQNDLRRDELRSTIDINDPTSSGFDKNMDKLQAKVADRFKGLAVKADKMAASSGDPQWKELAERAWERVLEADPDGKIAKQAHEALKHPKFDGEYCSPFKLRFLKSRKERKQAGEALAAKQYDVEKVPADGLIPKSGLAGFGARSTHWVINTTHSQEVAIELAQWSERALEDIATQYGFPEQAVERRVFQKYDIVKPDGDELQQYLEKGAQWDRAKVTKYLEHFGGMSAEPRGFVSKGTGGQDSWDLVCHETGHALVAGAMFAAMSDLGARLGSTSRGNDVENWLQESVSYDSTRRLTGTTITTCGTFGRYGMNLTPKPGQDIWILLARRQVEMDDDVPLSQLWHTEINDLKGPETVKGYALLQFLFEHDTTLAQKFVWHALAHGTPAAVMDVYGDWLGVQKSDDSGGETAGHAAPQTGGASALPEYNAAMDLLDDRYREWILKAW